MQANLIAFVLGAMLVHCIPRALLASAIFPQVLGGLALIAVITCRLALNRRVFRRFAACFLRFFVATFYATFVANKHISAQISEASTGDKIVLTGYICSIPIDTQYGQRFQFCSNEGRFLVRARERDSLLSHHGTCWSILAKLKAPRSSYNMDVGSYERYLFGHRIIGFAKGVKLTPIQCSLADEFLSASTRMRWRVSDLLRQYLEEKSHGGLIRALVLGDRGTISETDNEVLTYSGTQHLLAISGLHVGLVLWFAFAVIKAIHLRKYALPLLIIIGLFYVFLVGFSPSAQRALIMGVCASAVLMGRVPSNLWQAFLLALVLVLLIDPLAPLHIGFWFSFFAVAVLIVIYQTSVWIGKRGVLYSLFVVQLLILLFMASMQAWFHFPVSWFALPANLVAIPWVSFVLLPLSLISALGSLVYEPVAEFGFEIANLVLAGLMTFLDLGVAIESLKLANLFVSQVLIFSVFLLSALVLSQFRILFYVCLVFAVVFIFSVQGLKVAREESAQVRVLDVGQGLSIMIESEKKVWVYDKGPSYARFSTAKSILAPKLEKALRSRLFSGLVVSHGDSDHASDVDWLVEHYRPNKIWLGEPERLDSNLNPEASNQCQRGEIGRDGKVHLRVLWPVEEDEHSKDKNYNSNQKSCVVKVEASHFSMLLMGDLEGRAEYDFIRWYRRQGKEEELRADVLVAGHHGAKDATSSALIKLVSPNYVVFSSGYANRFNHPSILVLDRVERFNAESLRTDVLGEVVVQDKKGGVPEGQRSFSSAYWVRP